MPRKEEPLCFSDSIPREWVDAEYALHPTFEIKQIDEVVYGVVRHKAILQKILPTIPIKRGKRNFDIQIAQELSEPIFDDDFMTEELDEVWKKSITFWLMAMHKDFRLKMIDIDASNNSNHSNIDIQTLNIREATLTVTDYKERGLFRGYDILRKDKTGAHPQGLIDTKVKGLVNPPAAAGTINSFDAAGDNLGMDSAGDGPLSVGEAMDILIQKEYTGPYVWLQTPDITGRLGKNFNSQTHMTDIERIRSMIDLEGTQILERLGTTKYLTAKESVADNGSMLCFQRKTPLGEPTAVIGEAYPAAHYPIQMNSLGIKGKVLWMGGCFNFRPEAYALETDVNLIA